jgi:hypothetical protein
VIFIGHIGCRTTWDNALNILRILKKFRNACTTDEEIKVKKSHFEDSVKDLSKLEKKDWENLDRIVVKV